jgi:GTPase SAR1 family protein
MTTEIEAAHKTKYTATEAIEFMNKNGLKSKYVNYLITSNLVNEWKRKSKSWRKLEFTHEDDDKEFDDIFGKNKLTEFVDKITDGYNPELKDLVEKRLISDFEFKKAQKIPEDWENDPELMALYEKAVEGTNKLRAKKYMDVSKSIGEPLAKLFDSPKSDIKRIFVGTPGVGKSQAITNWVHKSTNSKDPAKNGIVIEVTRGTIGSGDISEAEPMFRNMVRLATALRHSGIPVTMVFEEAQDTIGEPLFLPMILNNLEGIDFNLVAMTNDAMLFEGDVARAVASRFGGITQVKMPDMSIEQKMNLVFDVMKDVEDRTGLTFEYDEKDIKKIVGENFSSEITDVHGFRVLQSMERDMYNRVVDAQEHEGAVVGDKILLKGEHIKIDEVKKKGLSSLPEWANFPKTLSKLLKWGVVRVP